MHILSLLGIDRDGEYENSDKIFELTIDGWVLRPERLFNNGGWADIAMSVQWHVIPICQKPEL